MKSLRYIFSYFIIWILIQFAYASSCFLIYGSYIEIFSSLYSSFGTMMLFIYIPFNTIEIMKIYYPMTTNLIFFSYIPIMYFVILNTMFTILYDSYITIQQKHPFNLLNFKVLRRGIIDYGYNIYSKLKKFGTRIIKLKS